VQQAAQRQDDDGKVMGVAVAPVDRRVDELAEEEALCNAQHPAEICVGLTSVAAVPRNAPIEIEEAIQLRFVEGTVRGEADAARYAAPRVDAASP
jgi:siroheme synthase